MFFSIDEGVSQKDIYKYAKSRLLLYPIKEAEKIIDKYLIKKYNITLRYACLYILSYIKFYQKSQSEITILIDNKFANKLAEIITYGNGSFYGSNILRFAFD